MRSRAIAAPPMQARDWRPQILSAIVIASVVFNFVLCFVNTNITRTGAGVVIGAELSLIATTLLMMLGRGFDAFVILAVYVAYTLFLGAMQGSFDPKPARDLMIPVVFYFAAREMGSREEGDRLVAICVWTVLGVGLFEYFFLKQFIKFFDILSYYVSRGSVQAAAAELSDDRLFASGMRYEGRTLLPFLGEHRVSSVFLEPVSVGNFGAICFSWIVLREWGRPLRMFVRLLPVVTIFVFADARFGLTVSLLSILVYFAARRTPRFVVAIAPLVLVIALAWIGFAFPDLPWDNTLRGRILLSGQMLSKLGLEDVFAFVRNDGFTSDSGYTYTFVKIGLAGFVGMWFLFVAAPARDLQSWRYRMFAAVYMTLLLIISNSIYSIKTAALLWYLVGALDAQPRAAMTSLAPVLGRGGRIGGRLRPA
ncbi:MAG: surface polysaccharide polymerase [Hyphomicrobiales bacterium]|nr:surface polysaccharide polymerase [Hyphomicrobiales bacterium]